MSFAVALAELPGFVAGSWLVLAGDAGWANAICGEKLRSLGTEGTLRGRPKPLTTTAAASKLVHAARHRPAKLDRRKSIGFIRIAPLKW